MECADGEECVIAGEGRAASAACVPGELLLSDEPVRLQLQLLSSTALDYWNVI